MARNKTITAAQAKRRDEVVVQNVQVTFPAKSCRLLCYQLAAVPMRCHFHMLPVRRRQPRRCTIKSAATRSAPALPCLPGLHRTRDWLVLTRAPVRSATKSIISGGDAGIDAEPEGLVHDDVGVGRASPEMRYGDVLVGGLAGEVSGEQQAAADLGCVVEGQQFQAGERRLGPHGDREIRTTRARSSASPRAGSGTPRRASAARGDRRSWRGAAR